MKNISINLTPETEGKSRFSATSAQSSFTPRLNLSQGTIEKPSPHATTEGTRHQDSAKASQQQLQEALAEQRLTDCLEHLENLNFLGEETQLFCLNLAQDLQRGCGV
ncbi:hypothetical protein NDA03_25960 [Trichocoleus sp. Lan]|uniref:hypothetical protein n=1 Tax=Trichocoleus sp. Lan TaxID=2933927 RepID=UPI00329A56CD